MNFSYVFGTERKSNRNWRSVIILNLQVKYEYVLHCGKNNGESQYFEKRNQILTVR